MRLRIKLALALAVLALCFVGGAAASEFWFSLNGDEDGPHIAKTGLSAVWLADEEDRVWIALYAGSHQIDRIPYNGGVQVVTSWPAYKIGAARDGEPRWTLRGWAVYARDGDEVTCSHGQPVASDKGKRVGKYRHGRSGGFGCYFIREGVEFVTVTIGEHHKRYDMRRVSTDQPEYTEPDDEE